MSNSVAAEAEREKLFTRWVTDYGDAVLRLCIVYLKNLSDAQDAAQDTFLKAWKSMHQYAGRNGASEKTWLMRIAMNTCHDYHRSMWFRHTDLTAAIEELPQKYLSVEPKDVSLMLDIMRLREPLKQVILLYYYENMTIEEVAETLKLSISGARKRLHKAEEQLKRVLTGGVNNATK